MTRTRAKEVFGEADVRAQTEGVECHKDAAIADEIPGVYKDIHQVMAEQIDLVEPVYELKQVLCVMGGGARSLRKEIIPTLVLHSGESQTVQGPQPNGRMDQPTSAAHGAPE